MRTNKKRIPEPERAARKRAFDRNGMLQPLEHRQAIPVEFLLEFTRALIRIAPSSDAFYLAAARARSAHPITEEQAEAFAQAVLYEQGKSVWPKGFFA